MKEKGSCNSLTHSFIHSLTYLLILRLKRYGARILSMDQIEGLKPHDENWGDIDCDDIDEGGDPPRVWSTKGNWPGTAFSRSIGDKAAKDLGVTAEPEILERVIDH